MKIQKLFIRAVTACLFLGSASVAMAVECDGIIADDIVPSIEVGAGASCIVVGARVTGNVDVSSGATFVMIESDVGGRVLVRQTDLVYIANTRLTERNLVVRNNGVVYIIDNDTKAGSMRINGNISATVNRNDVARDLICRRNGDLTSLLNAVEGTENCPL